MNTHNSKTKLLASITIMLLFASAMLAVVPSANAITSVTLSAPSGCPGETYVATVTAENPGATVVIYWNEVLPANRLNSTRLTGSNLITELSFTVPSVAKGEYAIIAAEELASGGSSSAATKFAAFDVEPRITLNDGDPDTTAARGDTVTIRGTGFNYTTGANANAANTVLFYITPLSGGAFTPFTVSPTTVRANANGAFTATFTIPTIPADADYGDYKIEAKQGIAPATVAHSVAEAVLTVGPVLTINPTKATTGQFVTVSGRGFTPSTSSTTHTVTGLTVATATSGIYYTPDPVTIDGNGRFTLTLMVPMVPATGNRTVTATDSGGQSGSAELDIIGRPGLTASPRRWGAPTQTVGSVTTAGDVITFSGQNFTSVAGRTVQVELQNIHTGHTYNLGTVTTDMSGSFSIPYTVIEGSTGQYYVKVNDGNC
jgi:hypothetical protein